MARTSNKHMIRNFFIVLLLAVSAPLVLQGQSTDDCYPPKPDRLVVDASGILSPEQEQSLETKLRDLNRETSNQVVIVTIDELCAGDAAMTAYEIGKRWKVGQKEFDNGLVILVKPKVGNDRGHAFIATGYGLEGAIPDATAKLIVDKEMIPHFKNGDYYGGLNAAVDVVSQLTTGEYNYKDYNKKNESKSPGWGAAFPILFILGIWFFLFYRRTRQYARTNNLGFWAAWAMMAAASRSHSSHYSNFRGGSGGFGGGGGGGGFGGFGGGSFGGGGAGGSW